MKKAMPSQPMAGKSEQEIAATRERAIHALEARGYEVVNTLFTDERYNKDAMEKRELEDKPKKKVLNLFTSSSLDGVGCSVVVHQFAKGRFDSVSVQYCTKEDFEGRLNDFFDCLDMADDAGRTNDFSRFMLVLNFDVRDISEDTWMRLLNSVDSYPIRGFWMGFQPRNMSYTHWVCNNLIPSPTPALSAFVSDVDMYVKHFENSDEGVNAHHLNILLDMINPLEFEMLVGTAISENPEEHYIVAHHPEWTFVREEYRKRMIMVSNVLKTVSAVNYDLLTQIHVAQAPYYFTDLEKYVLHGIRDAKFCVVVCGEDGVCSCGK